MDQGNTTPKSRIPIKSKSSGSSSKSEVNMATVQSSNDGSSNPKVCQEDGDMENSIQERRRQFENSAKVSVNDTPRQGRASMASEEIKSSIMKSKNLWKSLDAAASTPSRLPTFIRPKSTVKKEASSSKTKPDSVDEPQVCSIKDDKGPEVGDQCSASEDSGAQSSTSSLSSEATSSKAKPESLDEPQVCSIKDDTSPKIGDQCSASEDSGAQSSTSSLSSYNSAASVPSEIKRVHYDNCAYCCWSWTYDWQRRISTTIKTPMI